MVEARPFLFLRNQVAADDWVGGWRNGQHECIVIVPGRQGERGQGIFPFGPVRFEIGPGRLQLVAILDLLEAWTVRPDILPALELAQRVVVAAEKFDLTAKFDALDLLPVGGWHQPIDAMEEFDLHAALLQDLVDRLDDRIAGGAVELPDDRTLIGRRVHQRDHHGPRLDLARLRPVALGICEDQVVETADERRIQSDLVGAVRPQPVAIVEVIDALEIGFGIEQEAVSKGADKAGKTEIDEDPEVPQVRIFL